MNTRMTTGMLAACVAFLGMGAMASPAAASRVHIDAPIVRKVDQDGAPLRGMIWDGENCTRLDDSSPWNCQPFSAYAFTDMTSTWTTGEAISNEVLLTGTNATDCSTTTHTMSFHEVRAPKGYHLAPGELVLCMVSDGWIVQSNTSKGAIRWSPARHTVTFRNRKIASPTPPTTSPARPEQTVSKPTPGGLPATGSTTTALTIIAAALVLSGMGAVGVTRRRHG